MEESKPLKVQEPKEEKRRKRVYKTVTVTGGPDTFGVALDGRPLHTPSRTRLQTSSKALVDAVAQEWDNQKEFIDPASMPLTKLLNTALDRIAPNMAGVIEGLMSYVNSDLLCYRAERPESLVERQAKVWQPILDRLAATRGITLTICSGLMPHTQTNDTVSAMTAALENCDVTKLTVVQSAASLTGSLALGFSLADGKLSAAEVAAAAYLDETWQMEKWGSDKEALARKTQLEAEIVAVERFLALSKTT